MTDYQVKLILNLVIQIMKDGLNEKKPQEQIIKEIEDIRDGKMSAAADCESE